MWDDGQTGGTVSGVTGGMMVRLGYGQWGDWGDDGQTGVRSVG